MPDPEKVMPIPPMMATVIGSGTGDGGSPLPDRTVLVTPDHQPNVIVRVVQPVVAIMIRAINTFLTTMVGVLTAEATTNVIPWSTFEDMVAKAALVALAPTALGLLKDCITVFGKLEQKYPLMTGSI